LVGGRDGFFLDQKAFLVARSVAPNFGDSSTPVGCGMLARSR
jgi:hypothetical protein